MNNLLKLQNKNGRDVLTYHYKKIQDIDDVILQLLNEGDVEGFVRSTLDRAAGTIDYDITGYVALSDLQPVKATAGMIRSLFDNLYRLLVYLEDSFIDVEYVMFESDCVFVEPGSSKLYLIVLPCQKAMDSDVSFSDCLETIIGSFTYDRKADSECIERVLAKVRRGIDNLLDFQDLMDLLQDVQTETAPEEAAIADLNLDDFDFLEETKDDCAVPVVEPEEEIHVEMNLVNSLEAAEETMEKMQQEVCCDLKQNLRAETEAELRAELRDEVIEALRQELRDEVRAEVIETLRQELRVEAAEELSVELHDEMMKEVAAEAGIHAHEQKMPYLIRRKTGEVIQLDKTTFIVGKMAACCDYVIMNNNSISRIHAVIKYDEISDDYCIIDCNSTNHIYLNGRRIPSEQPVTLEDGIHIHLATEEFVFQIRG